MTARRERPRLDMWLSIGSAGVVAAVLVTTTVMWVTTPAGPAAFELEVDTSAGRIDVEVLNVGGELATEVVVRATFPDGSEIDQTVAWLSPGERNSVVFLAPDSFTDVDVRVVSYAPDD